MITLLKQSSYKESFWKNGMGLTHQMAIYPPLATLDHNDFLWRISSAKINGASSFSFFPDCERQLIVWEGDGLLLNGKKIESNTPFKFQGEEAIECELINNKPIVDVGIIYKKKLVKVSLEILTLRTSTTLQTNGKKNFLFLANAAEFSIDCHTLKKGDSLLVDEKEENILMTITNESPVTIYQFSITSL